MEGQRSSIDPIATRHGEYTSLVNMVGSRYSATPRWGCDLVGSSRPFVGAKFRGSSKQIFMDGNSTCLVAFEDPGVAVRIYSLNLSSYAWTEVTAAATRFANLGYVQFALQRDPGDVLNSSGVDVVVCGNGTDECRIITRIGGTFAIGIAATSTFPTTYQPTTQHYPECWFNLLNAANVTYPTATGIFAGTANLGGTDTNECVVAMAVGAAGTLEVACSSATQLDSADYSTNTAAGAFDLSTAFGNSPFVGILVKDTLLDPVFNYITIELRDGATYRYIWNPIATGHIEPVYLAAGDGCYLAVFDLSVYRDSIASYINIDRMRWVLDHTLPAARTVNIIGVYGLGQTPCGSREGILYQNTTTFIESGGVLCKKLAGPKPYEVGGSRARNITLPEGAAGQNVGWTNMVRFAKPSSGYQVSFYRKDPGENLYYHTGVYQTTSGSFATGTKHDRIETTSKYFNRKLASSGNQKPPKGMALASNGSRMLVGGISGNRAQTWASDRGYPLRYVGIIRDEDFNGEIDEDSGTIIEMPGERVLRFLPMPNPYAGYAPFIAWTNAGMWGIEGPDPLSLATPGRLNSHGTLYPDSVAVHRNTVCFLDSEKVPRAFTPGSREAVPLGVWHIEDQFENGDCWDCNAFVWGERYNICLRAPNATKRRKIVYIEERTQKWWTHSYTSPDFSCIFVQQTEGSSSGSFSTAHGSKLIGISDEGYVMQLEKPNQTTDEDFTGTPEAISITIQKYLHSGLLGSQFAFTPVHWQHPWICWEESAGGSLTVTFDTPQDTTENNANNTGTVDMDSGVPDHVWRYFSDSTDQSRPGVRAHGTFMTITGNPTPGKFIRGIGIKAVPAKGGGPDVDPTL